MIYFSETVINQIIRASSELEVTEIINNSISKYKSKKVRHYVESYLMNMVVELEGLERRNGASPKALENIMVSIEILRKLNRQGYGYLL